MTPTYMNGGFALNRKWSALALYRAVLHLACQSELIIGVTKAEDLSGISSNIKKTSVLKVKDDVQEELSLHHDFNPSTATTIVRIM